MLRTKCTACGSNDLYRSKLSANSGVIVGRTRNRLSWKWVHVRSDTCLGCGTVMPFVNDQELETLRLWKAEDGLEIQQGVEEKSRLDPRAVAIAVAILSALASYLFYMLNVIDKMKPH